MRHKHKYFTTWNSRIESNILSTWHSASHVERSTGLCWYMVAHNDAYTIALRYRVPLRVAVGVIAALSPGNPWERNLIDANTLLKAHRAHKPLPMVGCYGGRNIAKCKRILAGEDPLQVFSPITAPKQSAFYRLILDPNDTDAVCVDRHAKGCAMRVTGDRNTIVRTWEYNFIAWHYRTLAVRLNVLPSQLQAVCWVTWRNENHNEHMGG